MTSIGHSKKYIKGDLDHLNEEQQSILKNKRVKIDRLTSDINHLSKTLLQTEDASTWPKHVSPNTLSIFPDEKSWNSIKSVNINSDKHAFKDMSGLTWNTMKESMHLDSDVEDSYSEGSSPSTTRLDMNDMKIYGAMPMEDEIVVVKCKHCHKPVLANQFRVHLDQCKEAIGIEPEENDKSKQRSSYSDDEESVKKEPKTEDMAGKTLPVPIEKDDKKKAKKDIKEVREVKKKSMKQKAPLDLDKQCGVIQGPNNLPCTRSLTCKSHSMGLKRAVEGRSQAYDILLAAYQKKAIGRPNGKEIVKKKAGKSIKNLIKLQQNQMGSILPDAVHSSNFSNNNRTSQSIHHRLNNEEDTYIDSDEEVKSVMQVFQMSQPRPLAERPFYYMKRRRQCYRLKDILYNVLTPKDDTMGDIPPTPIRQPLYHHQGTNHTTAKNLTGNSTMTDIFCEPNSPSSIHTSFSVR